MPNMVTHLQIHELENQPLSHDIMTVQSHNVSQSYSRRMIKFLDFQGLHLRQNFEYLSNQIRNAIRKHNETCTSNNEDVGTCKIFT